MAHETVTKSKRFYCISLTPDICKTPVGNTIVPIPYTVIGEFKEAAAVSKSVKMHTEPVILHKKSYIPAVKGDAPGTAGGIKSTTYLKRVETKQFSATKGANGTQTVQESRFVWMNNKNTIGRIYERGVEGARARLRKLGQAAREELREAAIDYKENKSAALHEFGNDAMDVGGKIGMGSAALGGAGLIVGATGVGLPAAAAMEATAAAGGVTSVAVSGTGLVVDSTASLLDQGADYLINDTSPDIIGTATGIAVNAAENLVFKKLSTARGMFKQLFKRKPVPGKTPAPPPKPKVEPKADDDGRDGGKTRQPKKEKGDKPSECCDKKSAPGGKKSGSRRPVHFGTGEERLQQTDFVLEGPLQFGWSRHYRSGSESEDWGPLGARWATRYTSALSLCARGMVYHDDTGRALRLPLLTPGQDYDQRADGFVLRCDSEQQFTLTWRDGSVEIFLRGPDAVLPHGYDGVNAMLPAGAPAPTRRYCLTRSQGRDGKGFSVEHMHAAPPSEVMLRVSTDAGVVVEAIRDALLAAEAVQGARPGMARIGRVEQVHADASRTCHVTYHYELDPDTDPALPPRSQLVAQTDAHGQRRTYAYHHQLLVRYTTYTGFAHRLEWASLAFLRERWAGNRMEKSLLEACHPITQDNSYGARAVRTTTADGNDEVAIDYVDNDTTLVTEADGGLLEYRFNDNWLVTEVRRLAPDGKALSLGRREWDADGMLLAEIDAHGNATRYHYDRQGNPDTIVNARGHVTRIAYDVHNQAVAVTDALGHTAYSRYDGAGRIVETTDALGRSTRYEYDAQGRLAALTDARGGAKHLVYDDAGHLVAYTDCSGFTSRYTYDQQSRLVESTDAMAKVTHYEYDAQGRFGAIVYPDGSRETYGYDAESNMVAHVDTQGRMTRYIYNGHDQLVQRIEPDGQTLQYHYDQALRMTALVNGNGESYRLEYDAEGLIASETGFDGKKTSYLYDRAGQLLASDSNGLRTEYARDALGQLQAKITADGMVRYAHDALGRLVAIATPAAQQRFGYDAAGQLIDERVAYALTPPLLPGEPTVYTAAFSMSHAYDPLGNRIETILPNGRKVDTQLYGSGHWHGTLWQGTSLVDLERDRLHREVTRQFGHAYKQLSESRSYDNLSRLSTFTLMKGRQHLRERHYGYDRAGNLTTIRDSERGNKHFAYDPLGQLLSAVQPDLRETFAFDPAGNLIDAPLAWGLGAQPGDEVGEQPSINERRPALAAVTHNLLRNYIGYTYQYDIQGNTVSKRLRVAESANDEGELELGYDLENRLVSATRTCSGARQHAVYTYDALGRRIAKQVSEAGVLHTTLFVWDGDALAQEIHPDKTITYLYEPNSFVPLARIETPEGLADYAPERSHLHRVPEWNAPLDRGEPAGHLSAWQAYLNEQAERAHQDDWHARQRRSVHNAANDAIFYYECDHLGTPIALIDGDGKPVWEVHYRAWGGVLRYGADATAQPLRFLGQYHDDETGLYYNRHRYYDPRIARYITQDPIGLLGGANAYQYARNPTGWVDPLGLAVTKGGCDPCCGKDPAAEASATQGISAANPTNPYTGKDVYTNMVLKKGTILYSLTPGAPPGFAVTNHALIKAGGSLSKYYEATQVTQNPGVDAAGVPRKLRDHVRAFRVTEDICVARGTAAANPQFGAGGATQYYVSPSDTGKLSPGKKRMI